jgi:ribA/ribD-fused uncharacterized protein
MSIESFSGQYRFLSNFYPARVRYGIHTYPTVEHAYQAAKTTNLDQRKAIREAATPSIAKRLGYGVKLRVHWEQLKIGIMRNLIRQKFRDPELRKNLLATGDEELIEGNTWGDSFWGVYRGRGHNWLGKLLMDIRKEIRDGH